MKQLTMQDLKVFIEELESNNYDLSTIPLYLSNDDELNGVHNAFDFYLLDKVDLCEDTQYLIELINQDYATTDFKDIGVLIS